MSKWIPVSASWDDRVEMPSGLGFFLYAGQHPNHQLTWLGCRWGGKSTVGSWREDGNPCLGDLMALLQVQYKHCGQQSFGFLRSPICQAASVFLSSTVACMDSQSQRRSPHVCPLCLVLKMPRKAQHGQALDRLTSSSHRGETEWDQPQEQASVPPGQWALPAAADRGQLAHMLPLLLEDTFNRGLTWSTWCIRFTQRQERACGAWGRGRYSCTRW